MSTEVKEAYFIITGVMVSTLKMLMQILATTLIIHLTNL